MKKRRLSILGALAKGVLTAILITLVGMLAMAAAVVFIGMSDGLIRILNQVLKILAAALGVYIAVGRGGERGLLTGAGIGAIYATLGYCMYILLGNYEFGITEFGGELTICVAAGALAGAVSANMKPARHK